MRACSRATLCALLLGSVLPGLTGAQQSAAQICSLPCDRSNSQDICNPSTNPGSPCPPCRVPKTTVGSVAWDCYARQAGRSDCSVLFGAPAPKAVDCSNVDTLATTTIAPTTSTSGPTTSQPSTKAPTESSELTEKVEKQASEGEKSFFSSTTGILVVVGSVIALLLVGFFVVRHFRDGSYRSDSESSRAYFVSPKTKQMMASTPDVDRTPLGGAPYQVLQQQQQVPAIFYGRPDPSPVKSDGTLYGVVPPPPPHVAAQQAAEGYGQDEVTLADRIAQLRNRKASAESIELGLDRVNADERESEMSASEVEIDMIRATRTDRTRAYSAESTEL